MDTRREKAKSNQGQPWITVADAAGELGIPLTRCYELIGRGELPAVRIGERSIRVNRRELEEYLLNNCRVAPATK